MVWLFAIGVLVLLVISPGFRKLTLALTALLAAAGAAYWVWSRYETRPRPVDTLAGIRLGMAPVDVKLAKGAPTNDKSAKVEQEKGTYHLSWVYTSGYSGTVFVRLRGNSEESLNTWVICERGGSTKLFGLGNYTSEEDVVAKLGSPEATSISADALKKTITYRKYKVAFEVEKGTVNMICVVEGTLRYANEHEQAASAQPVP